MLKQFINLFRKGKKMAKLQVKLQGKMVNINTGNPKVASCLAALIEACAERQFSIGMYLDHSNGETYQLVRIKQYNGTHRAYLINGSTGVARNSDKRVMVQEAKGGGDNGRGYVTTLPARKDRFFDPDNAGQFIDVD